MNKKLTKIIVDCSECHYIKCGFITFCHCVHPDFKESYPSGRRVSTQEDISFKFPEWCPLEDE